MDIYTRDLVDTDVRLFSKVQADNGVLYYGLEQLPNTDGAEPNPRQIFYVSTNEDDIDTQIYNQTKKIPNVKVKKVSREDIE